MALINQTTLHSNIKNNTKWSFNPLFERTMAQPLDSTSIIDSLENLKTYISSDPTAYPGQIITLVNSSIVRPYYINTDGTPKEVGSEISGNATIGGTLTVSSSITANSATLSNITVSSDTTLKGNLSVAKTSTFSDKVSINADLDAQNTRITGTLTATGNFSTNLNATIGGTLTTAGITTLNDNLIVKGTSILGDSISDNTTISGKLTVGNNAEITGTLTSTGKLTTNSNAEVKGTLTTTGIATFGNSVNISGSTTIGSNLSAQNQTLLVGQYNETDSSKLLNGENNAIFTVGKGTSESDRSNAFSVSADGIHLNGEIYVNGSVINTDNTQSDWNVTEPSDPAYIKNKPTLEQYEQVQSNWTQTTTTSKDYIKNKPPVNATTDALTIGKGKITLSDGTDSVSFTIEDIRKLLSLLNNNPALITNLSTTYDATSDTITFTDGTDTTTSSDYN